MDSRRARFEAQVMPHLHAAYRFARWLGHPAADAQDLVQEAMLRALRGFDGLRAVDAKAWLLTIVRNCHSSTLQMRRPTQPLPSDDSPQTQLLESGDETDGNPERAAIERDTQRTLTRLLAGLSDEHRQVLVLREMDDMSYGDIALILGIPIGTVMSRLARARGLLRKQWMSDVAGAPHVMP